MKKKNLIDMDVFLKSGKKGGDKTAKRGRNYYQLIGSLGAKIRWDKKKATDEVVPKNEDGLQKAEIVLPNN